ncbi:MAG: GFA family protein [Ancalomicrobiaceae bacterium]|nr:GFA family protein [Ancalomicrobiaceae bacterium]
MTDDQLSGSCLCGRIRWRARAPMRAISACHCTQCRKWTGHFGAFTGIALADVDIDGEDAITWYRASPIARRGFCATCGSTLFWQPDAEPRLAIAAGSIDGPSGLVLDRHIFCADKGDYYAIEPGVPQFAGDD